PAADVVADAAPGQLLQDELADVAAAVEADVDDERLVLHLGQVRAVELGVAPGPHVGHVDVADPAFRHLVDPGPVGRHPFPVAGRAVVPQGRHDDGAPTGAVGGRRGGAGHGQLDGQTGLVDQQGSGGGELVDLARVDGQEPVA